MKSSQTDMTYQLDTLPVDHPERNISLGGCYYKQRTAKIWKEVFPSYKISKKTYNCLGEAWTNTDVFCWRPHENNETGSSQRSLC